MKRACSFAAALCLCLSLFAAPVSVPVLAAPAVGLSTQSFLADGNAISAEIYNIDGYNYFKLRDIAMLLKDTPARFSVDYDEDSRVISVRTGGDYVPVGGELQKGADRSASCEVSNQPLTVNGQAASLRAYNLKGNNFFKLRDLGSALGFYVAYDEPSDTAIIASDYCLRRTDIDTEGYAVDLRYEIPVFYGDSEGIQKINSHFADMEREFVSGEWNRIRETVTGNPFGPTAEYPYYDAWDATVHSYSDSLISVTLGYSWMMGGVNDYGVNGYTFDPETGALLRLNDVVDATDAEIRESIARNLTEQYPGIEKELFKGTPSEAMAKIAMEDFDFYISGGEYAVVVFDKYEIAPGAAGMFEVALRDLPLVPLREG